MTPVFVFGSNRAGRHGAGAAKWARDFRGAVYGQGEGHQGDSYAIPTKDRDLKRLELWQIQAHVAVFIAFARSRADLTFEVTPIGCGLAGYKPEQIAPMFAEVPANVFLPQKFRDVLDSDRVSAS